MGPNRFQRALREPAMANFAAPGAACPARFAYTKWWEVIMQNEPLRLLSAAVSIEHLRLLDWRQCRERNGLGFAALENGRAVRTGQNAHFATNRPQILVAATIDALLFFQNADAKRLFLDVIECLRDCEGIGLGMFFQNRCLHFLAQCIDCFRSRHFTFGIKRALNPVTRNSVSDVQ